MREIAAFVRSASPELPAVAPRTMESVEDVQESVKGGVQEAAKEALGTKQ